MAVTSPFTLDTPSGATLHGFVDLPDDRSGHRPEPGPAVVICHGFKGFMEWGFFPIGANLTL